MLRVYGRGDERVPTAASAVDMDTARRAAPLDVTRRTDTVRAVRAEIRRRRHGGA
jgi:hypothetical protein